jgi:hypothetical protein
MQLVMLYIVCTNPEVVPKIAATFISPEDVHLKLLKDETDSVQLLNTNDIDCLLDINIDYSERLALLLTHYSVLFVTSNLSCRLVNEIKLMLHLSVLNCILPVQSKHFISFQVLALVPVCSCTYFGRREERSNNNYFFNFS